MRNLLQKIEAMPEREFTMALVRCFYGFLAVCFLFCVSYDWWMDVAFVGSLYAWVFWRMLKDTPSRLFRFLACCMPVPHMLGSFGMYSWGIGGVSWDVLTHIMVSYLGTLLIHSYMATSNREMKQKVFFAILGVVLISGLFEVIEEIGGRIAREGEGFFLRGPGDFCSPDCPCNSDVDTQKDAIDNSFGILCGLISIAYTEVTSYQLRSSLGKA